MRARQFGQAIWYAVAFVVLTNLGLLLLALVLGPIFAALIVVVAVPIANLAAFIISTLILEQVSTKQDSRLWRFEPAILALTCLLCGVGVFYAVVGYWKRPL